MLFIGNHSSATHWNIFIQKWRSCLCQYWRCCGTHLFPLFKCCLSRVRKYLAEEMMCSTWFSLPIRDSSLSVFIFVEDSDALMSCTQAVTFSLGTDTLREQVCMSHPIHVFCLSSWPSLGSFWSEGGSSCFSIYEDCSGLNRVWMTNKDAFLVRSLQIGSSMTTVMMSSVNPYI